jgi:transcriptional regulator with XRE-family HTH domain
VSATAGNPSAAVGPVIADPAGPTVLRMVLGNQLRQLRETLGVTQQQAADVIRGSAAKISRLESGRSPLKQRDAADLLTCYGVHDDTQRSAFLALVDKAGARGWWHEFTDLVPHWFQTYVGLEAAAFLIRGYEVQFIPGLLQTEDYARAVIALGHPLADRQEMDRRAGLRIARQKLLTGPCPPVLWVVIDEAALRRPLGGRAVMREQLRHLRQAATLPNVTVQIIPFERGGHAAAGGPFTILRFRELTLPDIVYLEQLTSATYLDKRDDTDHYLTVMNQLCVEALPTGDTQDFLTALIDAM